MSNRSSSFKSKNSFFSYNGTSLIIIGVIFLVCIIFVVDGLYRSRSDVGYLIAEDVEALVGIFKRIDESCHVISFDYQKNRINFLQIKKNGFVGSEVGSMNLAYPDKWDGPYLQQNPKISRQEYMIVYTHKGYFITPGVGVRLPNGKVVGKDLKLDENADVAVMLKDENGFLFKGRTLAAPLEFKQASFATNLFENVEAE
ncbi:MAG TPA: hypothetical protein VGT41_05410 [Candidatus Babeliales bacterium]|nr:hypothetical protein [Candidatus Babeliales bacterium]